MANKNKNIGILLVNLGTPDAPTPKAIKRFLSEFLHDKRVVDMTRWLWCPLLHGVILPVRAPKVAKLYQSVWTEEGSPLMAYSQKQKGALQQRTDFPVALGMTYGNPGVGSALEELKQKGCDKVLVLPLYPQFSATTTAAVFDKIALAVKKDPSMPELRFINHYHDHPLYIEALAKSVEEHRQAHGEVDLLLCSYHGIPKRFADNGDPYPRHCQSTTEALKERLQLDDSRIQMTYQSRFGREEWLQPYTDKTLESLPAQGIKRLDIMAPAFSSDCLETLEELALQCKEIFIEAGGESFNFIPCLNDSPAHIDMMAELVEQHSSHW